MRVYVIRNTKTGKNVQPVKVYQHLGRALLSLRKHQDAEVVEFACVETTVHPPVNGEKESA